MKYNEKRKLPLAISLVMASILAFVSAVSAQDTQPGDQPGNQPENQGQDTGQKEVLPLAAFGSALLAYDVVGENGNVIGDVDGIVVDMVSNQVVYLVVESDNFLNDTDALIPWNAFQVTYRTELGDDEPGTDPDANGLEDNDVGIIDPNGEGASADPSVPDSAINRDDSFDPMRDLQLMLNITESEFGNAPEFDEDIFEDDELGADWDQTHRDYWVGLVEGVSRETPVNALNTTGMLFIEDGLFDAIDFDVENLNGENLGEVENLVINPDGRVSFALMETDSVLDIGDQLVVVEMGALAWNQEDETFFLGVSEALLDRAPLLDQDNVPDVSIDDWDLLWYNFWNGVDNTTQDNPIPNTGEAGSSDSSTANTQTPEASLPDPTNLVGQEIYGVHENLLGTIVEVRENPNSSVNYLIVDDADQDLYRPLPYRTVENFNVDRLNIYYSAWRFNQAPGYAEVADIPAFESQPDWDRSIREFWGVPDTNQ